MSLIRSFYLAMAALSPLAAASPGHGSWAEEDFPPGEITQIDCGLIALHTLLALEERPTSMKSLRSRLPASRPQGYSMAEIQDASQHFGLTLKGVRLPRSDRAPYLPSIVYVEREDHGHFLVVRPVGHSGNLVQVIDSTGDPVVLDAVDLYASNQWTGLALLPVRPNWPLRTAVGLLIISSFSFVVLLVANRYRPAREGASRPSEPVASGRTS